MPMHTEQLTFLAARGQGAETPTAPLAPAGLPLASVDPAKLTAATYLGVSRSTIIRLRSSGELEGFHVGAAAMITRASLDAYISRQRALELERTRGA